VVFWAARVRSNIRADQRVTDVVSSPLKLAAEVGELARTLERQVRVRSPEGRSVAATA
jgi:hypothetical protein